MGGGHKSILTRLADEFGKLAAQLKSPVRPMEIDKFTQACHLVSDLILHLGPAMKIFEREYCATVMSVIQAAGTSVNTPEQLLDRDLKNNIHMHNNSASRSLVRVKRSLEMLKIIFEQARAPSGNSIARPVTTAYDQLFRDHHKGLPIAQAFPGLLPTLPTRSKFFEAVKLDEVSALVEMQKTVNALRPLIQYIDNLFYSRGAQGLLRLI